MARKEQSAEAWKIRQPLPQWAWSMRFAFGGDSTPGPDGFFAASEGVESPFISYSNLKFDDPAHEFISG